MYELKAVDAAKSRIDHEARHKTLVELVKELHGMSVAARTTLTVVLMAAMGMLIVSAITMISVARICM